jgi:hypothetical protein
MRTMFLASLAIGFKDGQLAMIIHDFRENPPQENSVLRAPSAVLREYGQSVSAAVSVPPTHLDELADCLSAKHIIASALDLIIDRAHVYPWCTHVH